MVGSTALKGILTGLGAIALTAALVAQTAPTAKPPTGAKPAPAPKSAPAAKPAPQEESRDVNLRAYVELLRSDVRSQKVAILTDVMNFSDAEDAKFWPIYRAYDVELSALNDERVEFIKQYAANYDAMTDAVSDKIALGMLDLEKRRNALKQKYYERMKTELSPRTAARFLQVENQLLMIIDLQISAALPVVR